MGRRICDTDALGCFVPQSSHLTSSLSYQVQYLTDDSATFAEHSFSFIQSHM